MFNRTSIKKYLKIDSTYVLSLTMITVVLTSFSSVIQQSYAEDYKLKIIIKNEDEIKDKITLSIKSDDEKEKIKMKINDDPEKIKQEISGEPGDKVKVCLLKSDDNLKDCQTKELPKDEDSVIKFKLEYKK